MPDAMPSPDYLGKVAALGPPGLLVLAFVAIVAAGLAGKLRPQQTILLSVIAVVFFVTWLVALPLMDRRQVIIFTSYRPSELRANYSLQPVHYRFGKLADADLDNSTFEFPGGREPVNVEFDLSGLVLSYETNLKTVIRAAQEDPACFAEATRGVSYSRAAAQIAQQCPGALVRTGRQE